MKTLFLGAAVLALSLAFGSTAKANPYSGRYSGYPGYAGYSGYRGYSGYPGYSGYSGYRSYNGISGRYRGFSTPHLHYYPGHFDRHRNHYHYHAPRVEFHWGGHRGHHGHHGHGRYHR